MIKYVDELRENFTYQEFTQASDLDKADEYDAQKLNLTYVMASDWSRDNRWAVFKMAWRNLFRK